MTPILTPAEALELVADGLDDTAVGALAGRPLVAIAVDDDPVGEREVSRLAAVLRESPVVLVGVWLEPGPPPGTGLGLDILLCGAGGAPRPWVSCPDGVDAELAHLAAAADRSPGAAVAMAQLLRVGEALASADAVVAESWVYSLLQAGAHHRAWLDERSTRPRKPRPDRPVVIVERQGSVLALTLDRPEVRNAYGTRTRDELVAALQLAAVDESVEVVELRGNGPAFCSGGDLDEFGTAGDPAAAHVVRTTRNAGVQIARLADRVRAFVHGPCVGAGVELPAFAADVVARSDATFLLPEVAMGLVPGAGGTASIPRRIGRHRTAHLALAGRPIDAATGLDWGLVDHVDDDAFPVPDPEPAPPTGATDR
jgi:enoyl-CoA hydratase/carnithine racemase